MADEKYRLTLEGSDIDEALLRLANYEDEGLVLGSQKGVMLGPGSKYYHKNARYYAELAQSAVPGDTTSAVRWDIDQSALTDADRELARQNIRAGGSNPNLLDNSWWNKGNVINQRGFSSGNGAGAYTIDRWTMTTNSAISMELTDDGMKFTVSSPTSWGFFRHFFEVDGLIDQEATYTLSVMDSDGNIYSTTRTFVPDTSSETRRTINGVQIALALYGKGVRPYVAICFIPGTSGSFTLRAIKLELGSVSTLKNDAPPNYGEELKKCQYYFRRIKNTGGSNRWLLSGFMATASTGVFHLQNQMRDAGATISYSGTLLLNGGAVTSVTAYNDAGWTTIHVGTSASFTAFGGAGLVVGSGGYIDISRDI